MDTSIWISIIIGVLGILFGLISPYIYERFISPFILKKTLMDLSGDYYSLAYTADNKSNETFTTEILNISQTGKKIMISVIETDLKYKYEFSGELEGDYIVGKWKSITEGINYEGTASFHVSKETDILGVWFGDTQMFKVGWGIWLMVRNKDKLEEFKGRIDKKYSTTIADLNEILIS